MNSDFYLSVNDHLIMDGYVYRVEAVFPDGRAKIKNLETGETREILEVWLEPNYKKGLLTQVSTRKLIRLLHRLHEDGRI